MEQKTTYTVKIFSFNFSEYRDGFNSVAEALEWASGRGKGQLGGSYCVRLIREVAGKEVGRLTVDAIDTGSGTSFGKLDKPYTAFDNYIAPFMAGLDIEIDVRQLAKQYTVEEIERMLQPL